MAASRFCRYELRTKDMAAARAFYAEVLGEQLWGPDVTIAPLPERAAARGAPPHWVGYLGIHDVEETVNRLTALGGQPLGPMQKGAGGAPCAVLKDPFGAILGLSAEAAPARSGAVASHLLHTEDRERAFAVYSELFGWTATELSDLGSELGSFQSFAWDASGESVGSVSDSARQPHIHPQWLYCFRVADIESALDRARAGGAKALPIMRTPGGDLVAGCDDPQGGAFALYQLGPAKVGE